MMFADGKERLWDGRADRETASVHAKFLAMCVRNAIEDLHAEGGMTDETMAKLNPLVRNAIYTGLVAMDDFPLTMESIAYVEFTRALIPDYWEEPKLLPEANMDRSTPPPPFTVGELDIPCPHCGAEIGQQCYRLGKPHCPMKYPHRQRGAQVRGAVYHFIERFEPI